MKLTQKGLLEVLMAKSVYHVAKEFNISVGYAYKLRRIYRLTNELPKRNDPLGRPENNLSQAHITIVNEAYNKYRICACRLRNIIQRDYKINISTYTIHKILRNLNLAKPKEKKDVRKKKWNRYEREHSLTAVHLDWLYHPELELWVLPIIDDSSRKLLALKESLSATTEETIDAMKEAMRHGEIEQCITDHGTQFIKDETKRSRFSEFLEANKIQHILCRIKHPQSNGKSEKFGHLYKIHRTAFKTREDFIHWYNEVRPHMSLDEQTPEQAYQARKKIGRKYLT
jgi:putative transposase